MPIQIFEKPGSIDRDDFTPALRQISDAAFVDNQKPDDKYLAMWNDDVAPVPTVGEMETARDVVVARRQAIDNNRVGAAQKLVNNAGTLRSASQGIPEAKAALDSIRTVRTDTLVNMAADLEHRQGVTLYVSSLVLRMVAVLDQSGDLPDQITDEFVKQ